MNRLLTLLLALVIAGMAMPASAQKNSSRDTANTRSLEGVVTDAADSPVEGAVVMQAGGAPAFTTGKDGAYAVELTRAIAGTPAVVAAKIGYRTAGVELVSLPEGPVDLERQEREQGGAGGNGVAAAPGRDRPVDQIGQRDDRGGQFV